MTNGADDAGDGGKAASLTVEQRIAQLEARVEWLESALPEIPAEFHAIGRDDISFDRWSPAGYPVLPRGQEVGVSGDLPPHDFLASGWWGPEAWGVWGRADQHSLRFHIADYAKGYVDLRLTLLGLVPAGHDRPDIEITANGYFLGQHSLSGTPRTLPLRLPPSSIGNGDVTLYMRYSRPVSPALMNMNGDMRLLGAGFIAMTII